MSFIASEGSTFEAPTLIVLALEDCTSILRLQPTLTIRITWINVLYGTWLY